MSLSGIISISGKPGLHKVISQTKNGLIVESLMDKRRFPVYASQRVSALEDISIYTYDDDVPLADVFKGFHDKLDGKEAMHHKSDVEELRAFLKEVLADYDEDRVYNSDVIKLFQWYNILVQNELLNFEEETQDSAQDADTESSAKEETA